MHTLPAHITRIQGTQDGPCVVIIGALHGNERIGAVIITELQKKIREDKLHGTLFLIIGNPPAYSANTRFIKQDLNRLFGPGIDALMKQAPESLTVEEKRAAEIAPVLRTADYLLDIHSTIKPSIPFVYCEQSKKHLELAALFGTEYVVSTSSQKRIPELVSSTDSYVDIHGGIGITLETGWHKDKTPLQEIMKKIVYFLGAIGSMEVAKPTLKTTAPIHLAIYDSVVPQTEVFQFTKDFMNFDIVHAGEIVAKDAGVPIQTKKKSFVIFPKIDIQIGLSACYLATDTSSI